MEYKNFDAEFHHGKISIYNMDCMGFLKQTPDKYYELAICDPPYGIGTFSQNHGKRDAYTWNNSIPNQEYFEELERVSIHQIIWGGANYYNCFSGKQGAIVWHKENPHPDMSECEIASNSIEKQVRYIHKRWYGFVGTQSKWTTHPCEKPVYLYEWCLSKFAKTGYKILDTHLGSGSIAIACHYTGYDLVGCEIDKDYFEAAKTRIELETRQAKFNFKTIDVKKVKDSKGFFK